MLLQQRRAVVFRRFCAQSLLFICLEFLVMAMRVLAACALLLLAAVSVTEAQTCPAGFTNAPACNACLPGYGGPSCTGTLARQTTIFAESVSGSQLVLAEPRIRVTGSALARKASPATRSARATHHSKVRSASRQSSRRSRLQTGQQPVATQLPSMATSLEAAAQHLQFSLVLVRFAL